MFQFRRFPAYAYFDSTHADRVLLCRVSPFGNLRDQCLCAAPRRLIAACHVLHRLLMPRHSPCALISLTSSKQILFRSESCSLIHHELCRLHGRSVHCSSLCSTHLLQNSFRYSITLSSTNLLCYLSVACSQFLACFTVQFSRCRPLTFFKARLKCSDDCPNTSIYLLVEVTGLEPVTPCLQSRCSTS